MSRRRATDVAVHFVSYDLNTGKILGLYNSLKHERMPINRIEISEATRDAILKYPGQYSVDLSSRKVVRENNADTVQEDEPTATQTLAAGVEHKGLYYAADPASRAYLSECLVLASFDTDRTFDVLAFKDGQPKASKIDKEDLLCIMRKISIEQGNAVKQQVEARLKGVGHE